MPFFCLRYYHPHTGDSPFGRPEAGFDASEPGWRSLSVDFPAEIWCRNPCGVWQGAVAGLNCLLLCDGFIARPRPFDAIDPVRDLRWLAEALCQRGAEALDDLEGQYAVCFLNGDTGELIVARDRLGGQSLYWHGSRDAVAVASKSRDLARLPTCTAVENPRFVSAMFALCGQHTPGITPFSAVNEVVPGGRLRFGPCGVYTDRPSFQVNPPACETPEDWVETFRQAFRKAVRDTLGGYGDIAMMLSGGLDSGPILSVAIRELRSRQRRASAVSWVLSEFPENDESTWIQLAADSAGVELETFDGGYFSPFSDLTMASVSPELPYYNSMRGILMECYRRAAVRRSAMVLAATQGDIIYAQRFAILDDLIRRKDWPRLWAELGYLYRRLGISGMYRDPAVRYPAARIKKRWRGDGKRPRQAWLTEYAAEHVPDRVSWPPEAERYPNPEHARQLLGPAMTFGTAQENDYSQRHGVERRDPFLNETLVGLMLHAPVVLSHTKGQAKWIMREAMRGRIPEPIRMKERTGILTSFVKVSFDRHRGEIREFLLDQDESIWARYVKPAFVREVLSARNPSDSGLMVICACIGYTLWRDYWDRAK